MSDETVKYDFEPYITGKYQIHYCPYCAWVCDKETSKNKKYRRMSAKERDSFMMKCVRRIVETIDNDPDLEYEDKLSKRDLILYHHTLDDS